MCVLASGSAESFFQLLGVLLIFLFVLVITYLTTRWMGGIQKGRLAGKNIRVIETIALGNNKMISLVEVGKKFLVVSVGKEEIHLLAQLEREDLIDFSVIDDNESDVSVESFREILLKLKDKIPK